MRGGFTMVLFILFLTFESNGGPCNLQLLRSSLVNSRTQSIVCDDLGMTDYVIYSNTGSDKIDMKTKQKADLLECESLKSTINVFTVRLKMHGLQLSRKLNC